MRVAVISDIHSNLPALEAVLADVDGESPDQIWCLGDIVGYGPHPNECVDLTQERTALSLCGNHDLAVLGAIDVSELDRDELTTEVIEKAQRNQNAQPVEPGVYEVVLEEYAVAEMLEFMSFMGFGALAVQEERSFMRLGEKITGDQVSVWDDGLDRSGIPASFDFEGVPKQRVDLIKNGVASGLVYDMQTAAKERRESTGHGLPAPNTEGPFAVNLFMKPASAVKADINSDIKRGIWVTRFWYVRVVHPKASIITGMTREGTFLIENGKITRPVKDLRFTQSILEALSGTLALTRSTKLQVSEYLGASRVPAVRLKAFDFTS